jgi:hypothetical protein
VSPSPCLTTTARRAARAVLVALGVTVVVLAGSTGAGAAPAQVPSSSSTPATPTTTQNLLSSSTTAPSTTSAAQAATSTTAGSNGSASDAADDNRRVWYVVAALVAVALALTGLTIWYWFRTRPTAAGRGADSSTGRHGRGSAPLDHDLPPEDTVAAPVRSSTTREKTPARGTSAVTSVPADLRAAALTDRARARRERRPLTADDAPDHDASDQDWAPRGTGEHERVDVDRPVTRRPDRSARAAALDRARDSP